MFHDMMHKKIEVYVDDKIAKYTFGATFEKLESRLIRIKYEQYKTCLPLVLRKRLEALWEGSTT